MYDKAVHRATRFYSPSQSFLKIEPVSQTLSCGSTVRVKVHYILRPEAMEGEKEIIFYYLVSLDPVTFISMHVTQPWRTDAHIHPKPPNCLEARFT